MTTRLAEALERLEAAVSPLAGIVTHTVSATHMTDESRLPNCASELASSVHTLGAPAVDWGSGAHPDPDRARAAALGEALERYSALYLPPDGIRLATARELGAVGGRPRAVCALPSGAAGDARLPLRAVHLDDADRVGRRH